MAIIFLPRQFLIGTLLLPSVITGESVGCWLSTAECSSNVLLLLLGCWLFELFYYVTCLLNVWVLFHYCYTTVECLSLVSLLLHDCWKIWVLFHYCCVIVECLSFISLLLHDYCMTVAIKTMDMFFSKWLCGRCSSVVAGMFNCCSDDHHQVMALIW